MPQAGRKQTLIWLVAPLVILGSHPAAAGLFRVESESFLAGRAGFYDSKFEALMTEFLAGSYESNNKRLSMNTNFSMFMDPTRMQHDSSERNVHLYTGDLNYEVFEDLLKIRVGRSFDTHYSIGANNVDAVAAELSLFGKQFHIGSFYGEERRPDHQDYESTNTLAGANLRFTEYDMYPWTLSGKYQQRFFKENTHKIDQRLTEVAVSKSLHWAWNPVFLADSTWDYDDAHWDRFDFATEVYPSLASAIRVRAIGVDIRKNVYPETPIFSIFSEGPLYEGLVQFETEVNSHFIVSLSTAYDEYQAGLATRQSGYRAEVETHYTPSAYGLKNVAYYFSSYGGTAYGDRVRLSRKLNLQNEIYGDGDLTYYDKITGAARYASHLETGFSHWFENRFKLDTFCEYNNNSFLQYDFRAALKLTYLLWAETL